MRLAALGIGLATCCIAIEVGADAVPPEPEDCPKGTVGVTDHSGPRCEKEAPKNCPMGWRGAIGGDCVLDTCTSDEQCAPQGKVCRDFSLCYEPRERWYGRLDPGLSAPTLPANFGPRMRLEQPVTDWIPINVCGGAERCAAPSECRPGKLCVSASTPAPAVMPRKPDGTVDARPADAGGSCAGCAGAKTVGIAGGVAASLAGIGLLIVVIRRRAGQA
jgi:hypothetical protein